MSEKLYKVIIEGENGAGNQVFEAETPEELQTKFKEAQTHATAKIREQAQELSNAREQLAAYQQATVEHPTATQTASNGFDRQKYFSLLYSDPIAAQDYALSCRIGMPVDQFLSEYQSVRQGSQLASQNAVNASFVQKHPELLQVSPEDDQHNGNTLAKIIAERGWGYDERNLEAAYALAKLDGKLKLPPQQQGTEVLPAIPTTITRPSAPVNTDQSEKEFLRTAPVEKVREYLEKKYQGARA